MRLRESIAIPLYVGGSLLIAFVSAFALRGISAEALGFALGTLVIPAIIAYAVHGRIGKRPNNHLGFARWLWWSTFVLIWINAGNYNREHMTTADVHKVLKQAVDMTPDSAIDHSGKSSEKIEKEAQYRNLMRSYLKDIAEAQNGFDVRREAITAKLDGIYQPESYKPARAKAIIGALNDGISLNNDIQTWANNMEPAFQARVRQSGLTDSEQQDTVRGFHDSIAGTPLWSTLHTYLATDTEVDQLAIKFYSAILKGNRESANRYIDNLQALAKKDTDLAAQVRKLSKASGQQAGIDGTEKVFQKTSGH